jgi:hypothetical protein
LKYLVVIALIALLLVLMYRRLRPYLKAIRNFINSIRHFQQANDSSSRYGGPSEKLVRCDSCGIWIPAGRALSADSGNAVFCSRDCLSGKKKQTQARS